MRQRIEGQLFALIFVVAAAVWPLSIGRNHPGISHYDEAKLSQPTYGVRMEHNVRVAMRDGVELSVDIYRPDAEGKFPTILVRTPYSNNTLDAINGGPYQSIFYAKRGYAVVQQDVRGRYDSDGTFYPFKNEANDGYDTDEWIGHQPWNDGHIATMGQSYCGLTQWLQAIKGSRYLTALLPNATTFDIYDNWIYTGGAFQYGFALSWAVTIDGRTNQEHSAYNWRQAFRHLPIGTSDEAVGRRLAFYRDWAAHPVRDAYWDQNSFESEPHQVAVPSFSISGWYDIFLKGMLEDQAAITQQGRTDTARHARRLMIGPWNHSIGDNPVGAIDFGSQASVDLARVQLRWYDYWLKGINNGVTEEPPIKIFVMGENYWRFEPEWPLARTQYTNYYLSGGGKANSVGGDGVLSTATPKADAPKDTFTYDPDNPVPTLGGNNCCDSNLVRMGPFDQRLAERRQDVLVFTTRRLLQPLEVTGPITIKLYASTTAKDTDFTAKLVDVHPNGYAQNLQDGIIRARYRESRKAASFIVPGRVYEYTIDLWATSNTFLPGHRIRLEISSSNFPRFDRNLNTGGDTMTDTAMVKATQTIYHDAQYPSHIVLPVIPRSPPATLAGQ
jgi:hypothetical protein